MDSIDLQLHEGYLDARLDTPKVSDLKKMSDRLLFYLSSNSEVGSPEWRMYEQEIKRRDSNRQFWKDVMSKIVTGLVVAAVIWWLGLR